MKLAVFLLFGISVSLVSWIFSPFNYNAIVKEFLASNVCEPCVLNATSIEERNKLLQTIEELNHRIESSKINYKKYYDSDLKDVFNVEFLDRSIIDANYAQQFEEYFQNHKLELSERQEDADFHAEWIDTFVPYLNGSKKMESNLTYIQFSDPVRKFGVFASSDLKAGTYVGEYTGELTLAQNTDYMWMYPAKILVPVDTSFTFGLDARFKGNQMRFVNAAQSENCNIAVRYVPYDNYWRVLYVTYKPIPKDMQLFVSYGDPYWEARSKSEDGHKFI